MRRGLSESLMLIDDNETDTMKRFFLFLALLSVTACATWKNVPERLDKFVGETEESSSDYSNGDWQKSKEQYQALISEYSEHEDEYTAEQKALVMKDIGRYHSLLIINSLQDAWDFLKTMIQILPSYWEGVKEVFKEFLEEKKRDISDIVRILIDPDGISGSIKSLVDDWDALLDDVSGEIESALEEYEREGN